MSKGNNTANVSDDVYIYPKNNKCIATKGNLSVEHLFHFESTNERYSRPPSAMSMRPMSPTTDLCPYLLKFVDVDLVVNVDVS